MAALLSRLETLPAKIGPCRKYKFETADKHRWVCASWADVRAYTTKEGFDHARYANTAADADAVASFPGRSVRWDVHDTSSQWSVFDAGRHELITCGDATDEDRKCRKFLQKFLEARDMIP